MSEAIESGICLGGFDAYDNVPFDLSDLWLALLIKHVFPNEDVRTIVFQNKHKHMPPDEVLWWYTYRYEQLGGMLNAVAVLPIANYYSTYNYPIYLKSASESLFRRFYQELNSQEWDLLEFGPVPKHSHIHKDLIRSLVVQNLRYVSYFQCVNWYLDVDGRSYYEYSLTLPKRLRNTINRKGKQLKGDQKLIIKIHANENVVPWIKDFQSIYDKSWKPEEGYPDFIMEMLEKFSLLGWGRLGMAYYDGKPIASQFWLVKDDVAYIYKLAHVKGYERISSGTLLTAQLMEYVIDRDKVKKVDFLVGDEAYKRDWMSHSRELLRIVVFNKTYKGRLMAANAIIRQNIKRIIKGFSVYAK